MPFDISPRMILNASLDKIINRENLEESVRDCEGVFRNSSENSDRTLRHLKSREKSDSLKVQLEYDDLTNVGHYKLKRRVTSKEKIIGFYQDNFGVEFYFERDVIDAGNQLVELASSGSEFNSNELDKLGKTIVNDAVLLGELKHNAGEILIGKSSRSLESYKLKKVFKTEKVPRVLFGYSLPVFPKTIREIVYSSE